MIERKTTRALSLVALVLAISSFIASWISAGATSGLAYSFDNQDKPAEQVYKNIQVLNGMTVSQIDGVMFFMSASLGAGCNHCHTNPWESDEKPSKLITRKMIEMTRRINKENFSGNNVVNCYTCHRGQTQTVTVPPLAKDRWPPETEATGANPTEPLPAADQLIDKYIRAVGGEAAIDKLKTIAWRGQLTTTNRMSAPLTVGVEVYQALPEKWLTVITHQNTVVQQGFDGTNGWVKDNRGRRSLSGEDLARSRHGAEFFWFLKLKQSYPGMRTLGKEKVEGREAYKIGATSKDGSRETLYFDAETGLLIRRYVTFRTAFGAIPEVTDFSDYKEVSGIELPFTISWSRAPFSSTWKLAEAKTNVPVDEAKFSAPVSNQ